MNLSSVALIVLLGLALALPAPVGGSGDGAGQRAPVSGVLLANVSILDIDAGVARGPTDILVCGERIVSIGRGLNPARCDGAEATRVDGRGRYVMPGLWDMHAHFGIWPAEAAFPMLLGNGVLGARDMGWSIDDPIVLRDAIAAGDLLGPRLIVAGPTLDGPTEGWPLRRTVSTVQEAGEAVAAVHAAGADFIKVHSRLSREVFLAIVEAAERLGMPVAGHLAQGVGVSEAVGVGQDALEHLQMPWCDWPAQEDACDAARISIAAMQAAGTRMTPTLTVYQAIRHQDLEPDPRIVANARSIELPQRVADSWTLQAEINEQFAPALEARPAAARAVFRGALVMAKALFDAGVPLMTGTDLGFIDVYPGESLHDELALLVEAGLTPRDALYASTLEPVRFLGIDDELGAVEVGKTASFILLERNPLDDIENIRTVTEIVLRGRTMNARELAGANTLQVGFVERAEVIRVSTLTDVFSGGVGGISVASDGTIYVADFRDSLYRVAPEDGNVELLATGIEGSSGNAVDSSGAVYQSAIRGGAVFRVQPDGRLDLVADALAAPVGIVTRPDGSLIVANCDANLLASVDGDGELAVFSRGEFFNCPNGVAAGPAGALFVSNFADGRILRVTADGTPSLVATTPGAGNGHLVYSDGYLYVAGFTTERIYRISLPGEVEILAGDGTEGSQDGNGLTARFVRPNGMAISPDGDCLYTNDSLRRLLPDDGVDAPSTTVVRRVCGIHAAR